MSSIDTLLRWSPLQLTAARLNRSRPAVLAFHGVDNPESFSSLMDIVRRDYHPISIEELGRALKTKGELPERSVLITFDDGHRSVLDQGLPILVERGLPAVAFVVAGLLDTAKDFWWSSVTDMIGPSGWSIDGRVTAADDMVRILKQVPNEERLTVIEELERSAGRPPSPRPQLAREDLITLRGGGIEIGNHTWSHPCLNRCDQETIEMEITNAHSSIEQALGTAPISFAYPNGDWDSRAEMILRELGYELGFLFDHRLVDSGVEPLRTSRLRVNSDTSPNRFEIILSGLHPALHRARGRS